MDASFSTDISTYSVFRLFAVGAFVLRDLIVRSLFRVHSFGYLHDSDPYHDMERELWKGRVYAVLNQFCDKLFSVYGVACLGRIEGEFSAIRGTARIRAHSAVSVKVDQLEVVVC